MNYVLLLAVTVLFGCAKTINVAPLNYNNQSNSTDVIDKDYTIGNIKESYVGNSMIIVKKKLIQSNLSDKKTVIASDEFTINAESMDNFFRTISISGKAGYPYNVTGTIRLDGNNFRTVTIDILSDKLILIDDKGKVYKKILIDAKSFGWIVSHSDFNYTPTSLTFKNNDSVDTNQNIINVGSNEIIYDGTDGNSFSLTYREYTGNDMIRPAFTQNVKYQKSQKKIRFKNTVISVESADNEKIKFIVISDE
jgi:hypothetical protein